MIRRPGLFIGLVFAAGVALGLGASVSFGGVDPNEVRTAVDARLGVQLGPLAEVVLDRLDEGGALEDIGADVRARQIRNLAVLAAVGAGCAVGLGRVFSGWTLERLASNPSTVAGGPEEADGAMKQPHRRAKPSL